MNPSNRSRLLSFLFAFLIFTTVEGCATATPKVGDGPDHLFQLSDDYWIDLSQIREIQFTRPDPAVPASSTNQFGITVYHKGSSDVFSCVFADEASAYAAWHRLVTHLGGRAEERGRAKVMAATNPVVENQASPSLSGLRQSLQNLTACRSENLISEAEYQHGCDAAITSFNTSLQSGQNYTEEFAGLRSDLGQLAEVKKDHLLSDDGTADIRKSITFRYRLAAPNQ